MSIVVLGLLAFLGYSLFARGYFQLQPEGKRYEKNSNLIMDFLTQQQPGLVDFEEDELELLSGNRQKMKSASFFNKPVEGVLLSIYHEPFIAYKSVYHSAEHKTGVIGVTTNRDLFLFILKKDHTDIFINKKPFGTIKGAGQLLTPDSKSVIASYELRNNDAFLVRVHDRPEAEVKHEIRENSLPQRIVEVYGNTDAHVGQIVKVMCFYLIGLNIKGD